MIFKEVEEVDPDGNCEDFVAGIGARMFMDPSRDDKSSIVVSLEEEDSST